jgi:hypothetical protein
MILSEIEISNSSELVLSQQIGKITVKMLEKLALYGAKYIGNNLVTCRHKHQSFQYNDNNANLDEWCKTCSDPRFQDILVNNINEQLATLVNSFELFSIDKYGTGVYICSAGHSINMDINTIPDTCIKCKVDTISEPEHDSFIWNQKNNNSLIKDMKTLEYMTTYDDEYYAETSNDDEYYAETSNDNQRDTSTDDAHKDYSMFDFWDNHNINDNQIDTSTAPPEPYKGSTAFMKLTLDQFKESYKSYTPTTVHVRYENNINCMDIYNPIPICKTEDEMIQFQDIKLAISQAVLLFNIQKFPSSPINLLKANET